MKFLAYILALSMLSIAVIAESQTSNFNLSINTTYNNNSITISSEGFSVTYTLTNQSNSSSHLVNFSRTYNITTATSCNQETLNEIKNKVDELANSGDYFENYVSCFGNLSGSQARLSDCQSKPTYKTEFDSCQSNLLLANSQRDAKDLVIQNLENETGRWKTFYEEEESNNNGLIEENNTLSNQRFFPYGIGGIAVGFGIAYYAFVVSKKVKERKDDMPQL